MTGLRHARRGLMAAALAIFSVAAMPAPPPAATVSTITIDSVGSPRDDVGLLTVQAQAPAAITSITASVGYYDQGMQYLTLTDFTLASGTATDGTWTLSSPITEQQLPLGNHAVKLTVADANNDQYTTGYQYNLGFLAEPAITVNTDRTLTDYDHQSVTFSGTATARWPDGTVQPLGSQAIVLEQNGFPVHGGQATTAPDGSYAMSLPMGPGTYYTSVAATPTMDSAVSPDTGITSHTDPVQMTASASRSNVSYGQVITVTGTVSYEPGSQWQPLAGTTVRVNDDSVHLGNPVAVTTVTADGTYSMRVPAYMTGTLHVQAGGIPGVFSNPAVFLAPAQVDLPLHVRLPVWVSVITGTHGGTAAKPKLTLWGCLDEYPQTPPVALPLRVERAAKATGPWKLSATVTTVTKTGCVAGRVFKVTFQVPRGKADYRVRYAGSPDYKRAVSQLWNG